MSRNEAAPHSDDPELAMEKAALLERRAMDARHRKLQRYWPLYTAAGIGLAVTLATMAYARGFAIELGASAFFLTYLLIALGRLRHMTPQMLRVHADDSDTPGVVLLIVAVAAVVVVLGAFIVVLNSGGPPDRVQLLLGIGSVVLGWLGLNTMIAFHYAYEYYGTDQSSPAGKDGHRSHVGGLKFPGSDLPDGLSFLYFSFVVAMTAQVSDVTVTSNPMRKLVLQHGILAYFFNTVILATAVNIVVTLGH